MFKPLRILQVPIMVIWMVALASSGRAQNLTALHQNALKHNSEKKLTSQKKLTNILADIEKKYNVSFNYDNELISPLTGDFNVLEQSGGNVEETLKQVLAPYQLTFEKNTSSSFIIMPAKPLPKSAENTIAKPAANWVVEVAISGKVVSKIGEGLPGVTVLLKGTTIGTTTGSDGSYTLTVPNGGGTLIFSFVGFGTKEVAVPNTGGPLNVILEDDPKALEEIVVVGYGVQRKSDMTGAVGSIKAETLQERPVVSLNQALGGRVTGANVSVNSGRPGGRASIRIRGNTSVSVANNPLYVIDGVILNATGLTNGSTPIDYINPNDIASIEVLKDASATAIYGARGANGVILVTTKRGNQDGGRVNYDTDFSVGVLPRKIEVLNSKEFLMVEDMAYQNAQKFDPVGWAGGKYKDPKLKRTDPRLFDASGNPLYDTDWQDETFQKAFTQNHQLSFTGGNAKDSYGVFMGYRNENGLVKESWLKRYSGRFVFDSQIKSWLKVGGSLSYNDQNDKQTDPMGVGIGIGVLRGIYEGIPIIPIRYPNGQYAVANDYPGMETATNPVNTINDLNYNVKTQTSLGNVYTNINLAKGLELRTTLGTNIINQRVDYYGGRTIYFTSRDQGGVASVQNDRHNSWQFENYLTYNKKIGKLHSLNGLLGLAWQHVDQFSATARSQRFQDDYFQVNNLGAGANLVAPTSGVSAYGLNSYFGRVNYGLKDKYLVTFTGRADGSSKFGSANRFAFFPSSALAWRVSEEEFMKNIPVISNLKLRTSYGVTGNSEITAYQALAGLGNYSVIFNKSRVSGIGLNRLANPDLRWEKTHQVDAGLELGLLENRLSFEVDVYRKLTTDMLLSAPVPATSSYTTASRNIGSMENRGIEFALNTVNINAGDFTWNTTFNISVNKNKVLALTGGSDLFSGATVIREGESLGSFFGYVRLGTWGTAEADQAAKYYKKPGDIKYQDVNQDGQINQTDRVIIGKGIPDGFGTLLNTFRYKNFDLTVDLQFMYGNDVLNNAIHSSEDRQGIANSFSSVLKAWTPENQNTPIAQFRPVSAGYDTNTDSHRVQDGSFLRGRNLVLAYKFSPEITETLHLSRLRLYAATQNFFLSTKYFGFDPEVSTSGNPFDQGVTGFDYPKPRVFMLGLNIGL